MSLTLMYVDHSLVSYVKYFTSVYLSNAQGQTRGQAIRHSALESNDALVYMLLPSMHTVITQALTPHGAIESQRVMTRRRSQNGGQTDLSLRIQSCPSFPFSQAL